MFIIFLLSCLFQLGVGRGEGGRRDTDVFNCFISGMSLYDLSKGKIKCYLKENLMGIRVTLCIISEQLRYVSYFTSNTNYIANINEIVWNIKEAY